MAWSNLCQSFHGHVIESLSWHVIGIGAFGVSPIHHNSRKADRPCVCLLAPCQNVVIVYTHPRFIPKITAIFVTVAILIYLDSSAPVKKELLSILSLILEKYSCLRQYLDLSCRLDITKLKSLGWSKRTDDSVVACFESLRLKVSPRIFGWGRGSCVTQRRIKVRTCGKKCPNSTPHPLTAFPQQTLKAAIWAHGSLCFFSSTETGLEGSHDKPIGCGGCGGGGYFYPLLAESPSVGAPPFPLAGSQQWAVVGEAGWQARCGCEETKATSGTPTTPPPLLTGNSRRGFLENDWKLSKVVKSKGISHMKPRPMPPGAWVSWPAANSDLFPVSIWFGKVLAFFYGVWSSGVYSPINQAWLLLQRRNFSIIISPLPLISDQSK